MNKPKLLFASALMVLLSATAGAAEPQSATLVVNGMTCASCPTTVKLLLKKTEGVSEVTVDAKTHLAQIKFDPDKTQAEKLAKAVSEIGYPTTVKK
jgi:mercuric ion binding protein